MDATYERILKSISEKPRPKREVARRALVWIAYARRPLIIDELAYAISVGTDLKGLEDLACSIPPEEYILDACPNLVSIDQSGKSVRFVHFSVQEFLTSQRSTTLNMGHEVAHREIAQACMVFLSISPKFSDYRQSPHNPIRLLHSYALKEWPHHLLAGNLNSLPIDDHIVTSTLSLFQTIPGLLTEPPVWLGDPYFYKKTCLKCSPPVLASLFHLPGTETRRPLSREKEQAIEIYGTDYSYVVIPDDLLVVYYAIAELDSVPVVHRLLSYGYSLNHVYSDPDNTVTVSEYLQVSPIFSVQSTEMATYLLNNGIDIEPRSLRHKFFDPLAYFAGDRILMEVFQLLLDRVVDPGCRRLKGVLQAAYDVGHVEAIKLLLDKGLDIKHLSVQSSTGYLRGEHTNILQAAACDGRVKLTQLLLDKGADVNIQVKRYGNVLQAAAVDGLPREVEAVQVLLDNGADVNVQGGEYGNALQAAAYSGSVQIAQVLLNNGADINMQGGRYGNALQAAAYNGEVEVAQLLLDKGADVGAKGGEYGHALQVAACNGKGEVIRLLLDMGADVNAQGGKYCSALQAAACNGQLDSVQALLDKGADVHIQGGKYGNALQAAAYNGRVKVVQLLLYKGADVNTLGGEYGSALQAAAYT